MDTPRNRLLKIAAEATVAGRPLKPPQCTADHLADVESLRFPAPAARQDPLPSAVGTR